MADAAVEFLLNNLRWLLIDHAHLIIDAKSQICDLEKDLCFFRAFLKDSVKKRKNEGIQMLVRNIRDVVYEAEDIIDALVIQATEIKARDHFIRAFKSPVNLLTIGKKVEAVRKDVEQARIDLDLLTVADEDIYGKIEVGPRRQKDVGFGDLKTELIRRLTEETECLDVISLIGMPGVGKTTLALKIFDAPDIVYEFPIRIWLYISQEFSIKDIFLSILQKFAALTEELCQKDKNALSQMVADHLERTKFLIVMDDVWLRDDWNTLRKALPVNNNKGKVLITSRAMDVGRHASRLSDPYTLRFFAQEESWELLRLEALGQLDCPSDLYDVGKFIAKCCQGQPLAIFVIGGILATGYSPSDESATRRAWDKVSSRLSTYVKGDPWCRMNQFISLSYEYLPNHMRACFLYLGIFPKDYEIRVSKLIRMWIAEGFIIHHHKKCTLEETAEKYLDDLIIRNLVIIEKIKPGGKVKTCRIHDTIRDFCRTEAGNERENFLKEIESDGGVFEPIEKYRRIFIHSNCLNFLSSKPFGPHVRSFVCIPNAQLTLPEVDCSAIPRAFKLLRVLDVKPIKFTKIPIDMFQLVHLRFIVMSCNLKTLPAQFNKLWNIQTFIVYTTSDTLDVRADIWKMEQLRHFRTNASATLLKQSRHTRHGAELQSLGTISAESCTDELVQRAYNLRKLGIRGKVVLFLEGKIGSFDSVGKMRNIEKLKLVNEAYSNSASEGGRLYSLPPPYQFPSKLRSLTLCATFLSWSNMSTLGLLYNLEKLKLKNKAFIGHTWMGVHGGFHRLEFLHIDHTDLCVWEASTHHFPRLKGLVLRNCEELKGIPIAMADIPSFQMLDLHMCRSAAASARKIQEEKNKKQASFNLSIVPANE